MKWFGKKLHDPLAGRWVLDPTDALAVAAFGDVVVEFDGGRLKYEINLPDKKQIMLMTYKVDGDEVVTDQPSHPRPERTKFQITGNRLILNFGGTSGRFLKI